MKKKRKLYRTLVNVILAVGVLLLAIIVLIITDSIWTPRTETGLKSHIINDLIISAGCFFIVRRNPQSVWYIPLICNIPLILSAVFESGFWRSSMCFPICGGWALSVVVSIIAANMGRHRNEYAKTQQQ